MVQLPGAHSYVVAIFGNQTYLTALAQSYHSVHAVHSFRGTFTTTRGVNVVESSPDLRSAMRHTHAYYGHATAMADHCVRGTKAVLHETGHVEQPSPVSSEYLQNDLHSFNLPCARPRALSNAEGLAHEQKRVK